MELPQILLSTPSVGGANYMDAVIRAGGRAKGGYCPTADLSCDGLLLCGGDDMDPALFGQENAGSQGIDRARDAAELSVTERFLAAGKPVLGICRGHQVINVVLGGTLIQDMGERLNLFHRRTCDSSGDKVHSVQIAEGTLLHRLYGPVCLVNSSHHQAVDQLGDGLKATAWSESGVIEGLEHQHLPVVGVQFHPERMAYARRRPDTVDGSFLFDWFLRSCREQAMPPSNATVSSICTVSEWRSRIT